MSLITGYLSRHCVDMQDLPSSFEFISHMIYLDSVFLFRNNAEQQCPGRVYRRCVAEKVGCLLVDKYVQWYHYGCNSVRQAGGRSSSSPFSEYSSVFLKWLLSTVVLCPVDEPQDLLEHYKLLPVG